jgi:hypothetical protein
LGLLLLLPLLVLLLLLLVLLLFHRGLPLLLWRQHVHQAYPAAAAAAVAGVLQAEFQRAAAAARQALQSRQVQAALCCWVLASYCCGLLLV